MLLVVSTKRNNARVETKKTQINLSFLIAAFSLFRCSNVIEEKQIRERNRGFLFEMEDIDKVDEDRSRFDKKFLETFK